VHEDRSAPGNSSIIAMAKLARKNPITRFTLPNARHAVNAVALPPGKPLSQN
jgi:hypothetical protein